MEFDQLKDQWRKDMDRVHIQPGVTFAEVKQKVSRLKRISLYEDLRDIALWLFVIFSFSLHWAVATDVYWPERIGLAIIITSCVFIIYKTFLVRAGSGAEDWTLSAQIATEVNRIEKKIQLLMQTATNYLLPLYIGLFLVPVGRLLDKSAIYTFDAAHFYYYLFCVLAAVVGYGWNRKIVETRYIPVLESLKKLQRELAENPLGNKQS